MIHLKFDYNNPLDLTKPFGCKRNGKVVEHYVRTHWSALNVFSDYNKSYNNRLFVLHENGATGDYNINGMFDGKFEFAGKPALQDLTLYNIIPFETPETETMFSPENFTSIYSFAINTIKHFLGNQGGKFVPHGVNWYITYNHPSNRYAVFPASATTQQTINCLCSQNRDALEMLIKKHPDELDVIFGIIR